MLVSKNEKIFKRINIILLSVFAYFALYPFLYIIAASFSNGTAVQEGRVFIFPVEPTLAAYKKTIFDSRIWIAYLNTIFYTFFGVLVSMFFTITGAFALSRENLPGKAICAFLVVLTLWFKPGIIPFYLNIQELGLINTRAGIILGFAVSAFNVILLRNYFKSIPKSLEDAAEIDGLNIYQILRYIYIPLSKPALTTIALFYGISRWNGYFWAMVLLKEENKVPLQVLLRRLIVEANVVSETDVVNFAQKYSTETLIFSVIVLAIIPVIIVYPWIQRYFNKGLLLGGVKE